METFYIILIGVLAAVVVLGLLFFRPELFKKFGGYIVGGLGLVIGLFFLLGGRRGGSRGTVPDDVQKEIEEKEEELHRNLEEARSTLQEGREEAQQEEQKVLEELKEIKQIPDDKERLQRLSDLLNARHKASRSRK